MSWFKRIQEMVQPGTDQSGRDLKTDERQTKAERSTAEQADSATAAVPSHHAQRAPSCCARLGPCPIGGRRGGRSPCCAV